jgi:inner membrane protein
MENLSHTLTGFLAARAGLDRAGRFATPTLLVAANIPDIDIATWFGGAELYLHHHRTWSHSLVGAPLLGAAVGAAFWWAARRKREPAAPLAWFLALGVLGALSHIVLDWITPYGTQLLWPFRRTWYAADWFFIGDVWVLVFLLGGIALPALFRLIGEEIGAPRTDTGRRWGARLALAAFVLLGAWRAMLHEDALAHLNTRVYGGRTPLHVGAFPAPFNPLRWYGVVETESTFEVVELGLAGPGSERDHVVTLYKPQDTPALRLALATPSAQLWLRWARFPHAEVEPVSDGWRVDLRDVRFTGLGRRGGVFAVLVDVDSRLVVRDERIEFARRLEGD